MEKVVKRAAIRGPRGRGPSVPGGYVKPKSLVIEDTQANIKAKQDKAIEKFSEEMEKKYESVGGLKGIIKLRSQEYYDAEKERKAEEERMMDKDYRYKKEMDAYYAKMRAEYSDDDD